MKCKEKNHGKRGNPNFWLCIPCYEYRLYSSEGWRLEYIHVQEGENIQRNLLEKYNNKKKANTYLVDGTMMCSSASKSMAWVEPQHDRLKMDGDDCLDVGLNGGLDGGTMAAWMSLQRSEMRQRFWGLLHDPLLHNGEEQDLMTTTWTERNWCCPQEERSILPGEAQRELRWWWDQNVKLWYHVRNMRNCID
jgi:hypothetical protein